MAGVPTPGSEARENYRAYLTAAKNRAGSWATLATCIRRELESLTGTGNTGGPRGATVQGWFDRACLPAAPKTHANPQRLDAGHLRQLLVKAVTRLVPEGLPGRPSFDDIVRSLRAESDEAIERNRAATRSQATTSTRRRRQEELARHVVGDPRQRAEQLDLLTLRLGSWITDGLVPPYVARDIDETLNSRLTRAAASTKPTDRLIVLSGPPKSGKTRCLVEALVATRPRSRVWWTLPQRDVVTRLTEAVERHDTPSTLVIVFDDLHSLRLGQHYGVTGNMLRRLLATSVTVAATIHNSAVGDLERKVLDHRRTMLSEFELALQRPSDDPDLGDYELLEMLKIASIELDTVLTEAEQARVPTQLRAAARSHGMDDTFDRLAEHLAAIDQLRQRCDHARNDHGNPAPFALLLGALDAYHLVIGAANPDVVEQYARWRYELVAPTRIWDRRLFEATLDWATEPIGGFGSPHALIVRDGIDGLQLLDSLVPYLLKSQQWLPDHLMRYADSMTPEAQNLAATWSWRARDWDHALDWLARAADAGLPEAMTNIGFVCETVGDRESAISWCTRAADAGHSGAMNDLARMYKNAGSRDTAITWYARAADAGLLEAMHNLGVLYEDAGDRDTAISWYTRAADAGLPEAMLNLGGIYHKAGDRDAAITWYTRAADADHPSPRRKPGDASPLHNLGVLYHEAGDRDTAITWYTRAADAGHPDAMHNLGGIYHEAGDRDTAISWYTRAADAGLPQALCALARLADLAGDHVTAGRYRSRARELGHECPSEENPPGTFTAASA